MNIKVLIAFFLLPLVSNLAFADGPSKWDIYQRLQTLESRLRDTQLSDAQVDQILKHLDAAGSVMDQANARAFVTFTDRMTYDFGTSATGSSSDHTATLSNMGAAAATQMTSSGLSAPFSFKGGSFPGTGGTCGSSLNAGASCTVVITYAPTATGTSTAVVNLSYFDSHASATTELSLAGTSAAPASIALSDAPVYDFGSVTVSRTKQKTITVSNAGSLTATSLSGTLYAPFAFKDGSYPGTGGTCSTTLAAGASCTVVVSFTPPVRETFNTTLTVQFNDGVSAQSSIRSLTGRGR